MSRQHTRSHRAWFPSENAKQFLNQVFELPASGKEQDWEIELSSSARISEFLEFYRHNILEDDVKQALAALIMASFEDAKWKGTFENRLWKRYAEIISAEFQLLKTVVEPWAQGSGENSFAVSSEVQDLIGLS